MTISVNWADKIINVPRNDMTLVQSSPTEIREMDLNILHIVLRDLEDNVDGVSFDVTHNHFTPINVGGLTLARVVELINDYTITFEDGQYAVNLIGANSNVGDRVNVNQVSVRSFNSAGLVTSAAIEFGEYGGAVTIDPIKGEVGSAYPIGTLRRPSGNVTDAMVIAKARGFNTLVFLRDITLDSGDDVTGMIIHGINPILTTITINAGAITDSCSIKHCTLVGTLDNNTLVEKSNILDVLYYNGEMRNCTLQGTVTLGGGASARIVDCFAGIPGIKLPTIDFGGSGQSLSVRNYNGELAIVNKIGDDACSINMNAGHLVIDHTIQNGNISVEGTAKITDNSTGTTVVHMDSVQVPESAYNGFVYVDPIIGKNGRHYPRGINTRPVLTLVDAFSIANRYNLRGYSIHGAISVSDDLVGVTIVGRGVVTGNVLSMGDVSVAGTYFHRVTIVGRVSGVNAFYEDCIMANLHGVSGILISCVLGGTIYLNGMVQSRSSTLSGNPTIIDFSENTSSMLQADIGAGLLRLDNMTNASMAYVKLDSGDITISANCTGGMVRISGGAKIIDNSNGAVTIIDNTINTNMANRVWDEPRADHDATGSFGAVNEWTVGSSGGSTPSSHGSPFRPL